MDQSNKALQVFSILDAVNAECDAAAKTNRQTKPRTGRRKGKDAIMATQNSSSC